MLTVKRVTFQSKSYQHVRKLYNNAFPKQERIPFVLLVLRSGVGWMDFLAFYEKEQFCGFACLTNSDTLTNIMYLAVDKRMQSQGYGSRILQYIRKRHLDQTIVLEIEALDSKAVNYEQQLRRKKFYVRNGFQETGYGVNIYNVNYEVLKNATSFQPMDWQCMQKRLTFGLLEMKLYSLKTEQSKTP